MLVRIDAAQAGEFERKISAFARMCKKFDISFDWKKVGEQTDFVYWFTNMNGGTGAEIIHADEEERLREIRMSPYFGNLYPLPVVIYEMDEVTAKQTGDFAVAAELEPVNGGNIVKSFFDYEAQEKFSIPEKYRHTGCFCDHCHTNRARKKYFVIYNRQTKEFSQVGGNCMKYYSFGFTSARIAEYYERLMEVMKCGVSDDLSDAEIAEYLSRYRGGKNYYNVRDVIKYSIGIIRACGYNKSDSYETSCGKIPTKEIVSYVLRFKAEGGEEENLAQHLNGKYKGAFNFDISEQEVDDIINHFIGKSDDSDFTNNIKILLSGGNIEQKHVGFLCCLPHVKKNDEENEAKRKLAATFEHFGELKKRYTLPVDECRLMTTYAGYGYYDVVSLFRIRCGNHVLIWKTQKDIDPCDFDGKSITFTVKEHNDFRGEPQTIITRAKIN